MQERLKSAESESSFLELAVDLGEQKGYGFSAEEVKEAIVAAQSAETDFEMSDEQLEAVAGGGYWDSSWDISCNQYQW